MALTRDSLEWAIDFIGEHSDGDLFPKLKELKAIKDNSTDFIDLIEGKQLTSFKPKSCRRFIVPKDEISYRQATQLHPQDSIILSAIIYQYGQNIEDRRLSDQEVFSYRFSPSLDQGLYNSKNSWNEFWTKANRKSLTSSVILYCDIADFYNQIYHHTVENQLLASSFPNQEMKWIISLLESTTAGVSRGVPIGPHAIHLLAESTLIPIDNSLKTNGMDFLRYADDILIFFKDEKKAKKSLGIVASILDKQQRLILQKHKTKIYNAADFRIMCSDMIEDRPISRQEGALLKVINKYTGGNPYQTITYNEIKPEDWKKFSAAIVEKIIN